MSEEYDRTKTQLALNEAAAIVEREVAAQSDPEDDELSLMIVIASRVNEEAQKALRRHHCPEDVTFRIRHSFHRDGSYHITASLQ